MVSSVISAKSVVAVLFASMVGSVINAKSVVALVFASMVGSAINAKSVGAVVFVSTVVDGRETKIRHAVEKTKIYATVLAIASAFLISLHMGGAFLGSVVAWLNESFR